MELVDGTPSCTTTLHCDIELANLIGMKRSFRGKLTVFHFICECATIIETKVSNIFLLAVGKSSDLKSVNAKAAVLKDFISSLKELQNGCTFKTACGDQLFFGFLLAYIGNSLACHNHCRF